MTDKEEKRESISDWQKRMQAIAFEIYEICKGHNLTIQEFESVLNITKQRTFATVRLQDGLDQ